MPKKKTTKRKTTSKSHKGKTLRTPRKPISRSVKKTIRELKSRVDRLAKELK